MGVLVLKRTVVVSTFRSIYSARLHDTASKRQLETTLALFRANTPPEDDYIHGCIIDVASMIESTSL